MHSRADKKRNLKKPEAARQASLRQQWEKWASRFSSAEEAVAEGISACERLARDAEAAVRRPGDEPMEIYLQEEPLYREDLSRLIQFDVLKDLWLRRNYQNVASAKQVSFDGSTPPRDVGFDEDGIVYANSKHRQLFVYELEVCGRRYRYYSYQKPAILSDKIVEDKPECSPTITKEEKQTIGMPFHVLVQVVELGARIFWAEHWSKKENRLLPTQKPST